MHEHVVITDSARDDALSGSIKERAIVSRHVMMIERRGVRPPTGCAMLKVRFVNSRIP
jgi:hypothetical protein